MLKQRTLRESVSTVGIGLHSGRRIHLVMKPAAAGTGIVFRRTDLTPAVDIPAVATNVNDTRLATTVNVGQARVSTIEHLMSAFNGLGIDNCLVEVDAPEIPVMDGSAASFVFLIHAAGIVEQNAPKQFVRILKTVEVKESGRSLSRISASVLNFPLIFTIRRLTPRFRARRSTSPTTPMRRTWPGRARLAL